jgi:hypothetical protein
MDEGEAVMDTLGFGLTLTSMDALFEHPVISVPVTE